MKITLSLNKTLEENAAEYFEKAKKAKKKIEGVKRTVQTFKKKEKKEANLQTDFVSAIKKLDASKKYWFEKFKWFITSEGFLAVGGRDATTNEIIIKKHTNKEDIVIHTDMAGSPFVVIKKNSKEDVKKILGDIKFTEEIGEDSINEAANFCVVHARAWKLGLTSVSVFWVLPSQVTKEAQSGESLKKGSFVITGKTNYVQSEMNYAVGVVQDSENSMVNGETTDIDLKTKRKDVAEDEVQENKAHVLCGPINAVSKYAKDFAIIEQGRNKTSDVAKRLRAKFRESLELDVDLDILISALPSGGCQLKKERKRNLKK